MIALDLFSGIGGFALACERVGIRTVAFCEIDPFCRAVINKNFPGVPVYDDIRRLDPTPFRGVDLVCGGFPCQDVSAAGKGAGIGGTRSGLWVEMARIIAGVRPRWCLIENVSALRTRGADRVLADLEEIGYDAWPFVVGAWAVGAPHRRDRVWIVAYANAALRNESGRSGGQSRAGAAVAGNAGPLADADRERLGELRQPEPRRIEGAPRDEPDGRGLRGAGAADVAHATRSGVEGLRAEGLGLPEVPPRPQIPRRDGGGTQWPARPGEAQHDWEEPRLVEFKVGESVDGISRQLVRARRRNNREALKAYGNAVVPDVVEMILRAMLEQEV